MKKGIWPFRKTWYSICSAHQKYKKSCPRCNKGNWHNDVRYYFSSVIYKNWPNVWRWWVNRKQRPLNFKNFK